MTRSYALDGPPFNFQGNLRDTQLAAFKAWEAQERPGFAAAATFHRVRSQQLRKAAGVLEAFYAAQSPALTPTFIKDPWQPNQNGHFLPTFRDNHAPAVTMAALLDRYQDPLGVIDNAVFRMNWLRTQIEAHEDEAQEAAEAPAFVAAKLQELDDLFNQAHYAGVLVKTDTGSLWPLKGTENPATGQDFTTAPAPTHRVHPFDPPTPWERYNAGEQIP